MKSVHHGTAAANAKLNGKLSKVLSCRCCVLQNFKWPLRMKEAKQAINRFKKDES